MNGTMDDMFEEVLAICLDRLADGDDVDACAADFPECPELRPLLEIADALSKVGPMAPRTSGSPCAAPRKRARETPKWLIIRTQDRSLRPTG